VLCFLLLVPASANHAKNCKPKTHLSEPSQHDLTSSSNFKFAGSHTEQVSTSGVALNSFD